MDAEENLIEYVEDRPGHDARYAFSIEKVKRELMWRPKYDLSDGLNKTIEWVREHENRI